MASERHMMAYRHSVDGTHAISAAHSTMAVSCLFGFSPTVARAHGHSLNPRHCQGLPRTDLQGI
eukprot:9959224-Karenia_brevis.AAC.1